MKVVISLGDGALLRRGEPLDAAVQRGNAARAAAIVAKIAAKHNVIVTHGNTPQVGLLTQQAEALAQIRPYPLDVLDAEAEGMIGYLIEQELKSLLPKRQVVTVLTQIEVSDKDAAFNKPSVPVGASYESNQAQRLTRERGWVMEPDGTRWRRVVPGPQPLHILELPAIRLLLQSGALVICAGGGGIPVTVTPTGQVRGVEAVIDKDLAAALLAHQVGADALLLLTDVDAAYLNWGGEHPWAIHETMPEELRKHAFSEPMKPKVEAACRFVEGGGNLAGIGLLEDAAAILEGICGTVVRPTGVSLDFFPQRRPAAGPPPPPAPRAETAPPPRPAAPAAPSPQPAPKAAPPSGPVPSPQAPPPKAAPAPAPRPSPSPPPKAAPAPAPRPSKAAPQTGPRPAPPPPPPAASLPAPKAAPKPEEKAWVPFDLPPSGPDAAPRPGQKPPVKPRPGTK